jgi:dTDP-4-dehydrorhamnose reductase
MKAVIIGANGQLGSDLVNQFLANRIDVVPMTHEQLQVENIDSVEGAIRSLKPAIVVNTAAFHVVPKCEDNPQRAFQVNALGALNVAKACETIGALNVYFSTDYVFDGLKRSPYLELDKPNPLNVYASTKLLGEYYTLNYSSRNLVLRVSGLYGKVPCRAKGGNFITTILRSAKEKPEIRVVNDEILTPTPTREIAEKTIDLVTAGVFGLFHLTSEGECSWFEFTQTIFNRLNITTPLFPCSVRDFPMAVKRPTYSVLENARAKDEGIPNMRHWKESLTEFLEENYR